MLGYTGPRLGAAIVMTFAIVGCNALQPSTETAPPSPTAQPSEVGPRTPTNGPLEAGTYRIGGDAGVTITLPSGWDTLTEGVDIRKHRDQPGELTFWVDASDDIAVYTDACANQDPAPLAGPSADDLLAALQAQNESDVADPVEVTMGGRDVMRLEYPPGRPGRRDLHGGHLPDLELLDLRLPRDAGRGDHDRPPRADARRSSRVRVRPCAGRLRIRHRGTRRDPRLDGHRGVERPGSSSHDPPRSAVE